MRIGDAIANVRQRVVDVQPTSRTVHRPVVTKSGPAPSAFAAHGRGSWLVPPVHVDGAERVTVGDDVVILEHLELTVAPGAHVTIGPGTRLGRFVTITSALSIEIGASVSSSDGAAITDCWGPNSDRPGPIPPPPPAPVVIEDGAYLGALCVIRPGVRVGAGAFVGEGAVVVDDVPSHSVVYGNPAVVVRWYDEASGWHGPSFG